MTEHSSHPGSAPPRRRGLGRRLISPQSYGMVLLLIMACYGLSVSLSGPLAASVVLVVQVGTVWIVLRTSGARRSLRRLADVVLVVAFAIAVAFAALGDDKTSTFVLVASALLYLVAPVSIMRDLIGRPRVDAETFLGAISAYLLMGLFFALAYQTIGAVQSAPFFGAAVGDGQASQTLFFSFTTLTTTGYGNLVPAGNPGQTMAVLEMLVGQIFLATAIAKVITSWTPLRRAKAQEAAPTDDGVAG